MVDGTVQEPLTAKQSKSGQREKTKQNAPMLMHLGRGPDNE